MQRRRFTPDFKVRVVNEALETGNTSAVARRHEIHPSVLIRWVNEYKEDGPAAFSSERNPKDKTPSLHQYSLIEKENDKLKKLLGEKDLEIAILRELLKKGSRL